MNIQESGEMYLENILVLTKKRGAVRSIDIVNYTGYSKPSISRAMGILKKDKLIDVEAGGNITLTEEGRRIAERIYERHTLLCEFLTRIGVNPETAAEDACKMEHIISDETFQKIKEHAKQK